MKNTKDTLNLTGWARAQVTEKIEAARFYISEGIDADKALNIVLKNTVLGARYVAQVEAQVKKIKTN